MVQFRRKKETWGWSTLSLGVLAGNMYNKYSFTTQFCGKGGLVMGRHWAE